MNYTYSRLFILIYLLACIRNVWAEDIDLYFMQQKMFTSVPLKAMGNAGVALPEETNMGWRNPALVYSSRKKQAKGTVYAGYGRDSLFNRHIVPVVVSYIDSMGAIGGFFRYGSGDNRLSHNELGLNFSGQLFEKIDIQGEVDFGVNIRYMSLTDKRYEKRTCYMEQYYICTTGEETFLDTVGDFECVYNSDGYKHHMIVDFGFYQPDIMEHLDFGLVISNCIGYRWYKQHPIIQYSDSAIGDSSSKPVCDTVIRSYEFIDDTEYKKGWLSGRYRILTVGAAYRFIAYGLHVILPVDLEIIGLFDKKMENTYIFRGGVVVRLGDAIHIRLGYAREPGTFFQGLNTFKNIHVLSGGGGVTVGKTTVDCFFTKGTFGVSAEVLY